MIMITQTFYIPSNNAENEAGVVRITTIIRQEG
jgi:hypothetical protein